jgi:hypothetical protein
VTAYTPAPSRRPHSSRRRRAARPRAADPAGWRGLYRWARRLGWPGADLRIVVAIAELGVRTGRPTLYLGRVTLARAGATSRGAAARTLLRLVAAGALVPVELCPKGGRKHAHVYRLGDLNAAASPPEWGGWRHGERAEKATQLESLRIEACRGGFRIRKATQVESPTPSLRSGDPWSPQSDSEWSASRARGAGAREAAEPAAPSPESSGDMPPGALAPATAAPTPRVAEGVGSGVDGFAPGPFEQRLAELLAGAPQLFGVDTPPGNCAQCVEPASTEALPAPDHGAYFDPPRSGCDTPRADA